MSLAQALQRSGRGIGGQHGMHKGLRTERQNVLTEAHGASTGRINENPAARTHGVQHARQIGQVHSTPDLHAGLSGQLLGLAPGACTQISVGNPGHLIGAMLCGCPLGQTPCQR